MRTARIWRMALAMSAAATMCSQAKATERIAGPVRAEVVRVIDGDTVFVRAHVWPGNIIEIAVRIEGIDTPELHGHCPAERERALNAKETLESLLVSQTVLLRNIGYDKFGGRNLAHAETEDGRDVARAMIAEGMARDYQGKARLHWCPPR